MESSARNLSVALAAALIVHLLILAQRFSVKPSNLVTQRYLTVSLNAVKEEDERAQEEAVEPPVEAPKPEIKFNEQTPTIITANDVIVEKKSNVDSKPEIIIESSSQSDVFKRFLKSETDRYISESPSSVGAFDQTFEPPPPPVDNSKEFSFDNRANIPRGTGTFIIEKDGKRTCVLKVDSLLSGDGGSAYYSADCTPPKKFNLNLGKPNNGWTDR